MNICYFDASDLERCQERIKTFNVYVDVRGGAEQASAHYLAMHHMDDYDCVLPNGMSCFEAAEAIAMAADRYIAIRDSVLDAKDDPTADDLRDMIGDYLQSADLGVTDAIRCVAALHLVYDQMGSDSPVLPTEAEIERKLLEMIAMAPEKTPQEHLEELIDRIDLKQLNGFMRFVGNEKFVTAVLNDNKYNKEYWEARLQTHCAQREEIIAYATVIYEQATKGNVPGVKKTAAPAALTSLIAVQLDDVRIEAAKQAGLLKAREYACWKTRSSYIVAAVLVSLLMGAITAGGGFLAAELIMPYMLEAGVCEFAATMAAGGYFALVGGCSMYTLTQYFNELSDDYDREIDLVEEKAVETELKTLRIQKDYA